MSILQLEQDPYRWLAVKRALVYVRASLDLTGEGLSVMRQQEACEKLIDLRGWQKVHVVVENSVSAYGKKNRPGYQEALAMMERGEIDVVVAWHLDRLTRNMSDLEELIRVSEKYNVGIATASGDIDLTTDVGRMVARILAAVARAEVERKAARQALANAQRAQSGKPWSGGARPFGYTKDQMHVVEAEALAIKKAAADVLAGKALRQVAKEWDEQGLESSRAHDMNTKQGWSGRGVRFLLCSPRYAGIRTYKGEEVGPGQWPAILDLETHLALRRLLLDPARLTHDHRKGRTPANLLTGIAHCGVCEETIKAASNRTGLTYMCKPHGHVAPDRVKADAAMRAAVIGLLSSPEAVRSLTRGAEEAGGEAEAEIDALRQRLEGIEESYAEGLISKDRYKEMARKIKAKMEAQEGEVLRGVVGTVLDGFDIGSDKVEREWDSRDLMSQRRIIEALFDVEFIQRSAVEAGRTDTRGWDAATQMLIRVKGQ
jgi:DNA invertase Pin-like site-specific DNA recombinase